MMYFYQKKQAGFSLVETLVAISILLIVIVGPMTISARTAKSSSFASEQVQAFFFAQEGLELAQKVRDEAVLRYFNDVFSNSTPRDEWADFIAAGGDYGDCFSPNGCGLQWGSTAGELGTVVSCATAGACVLYQDTSSVRAHFGHNSLNTKTPFTRKIFFESDSTDDNIIKVIKVRSEVTWRTGSLVAEQKVVADTYLYNIYDIP